MHSHSHWTTLTTNVEVKVKTEIVFPYTHIHTQILHDTPYRVIYVLWLENFLDNIFLAKFFSFCFCLFFRSLLVYPLSAVGCCIDFASNKQNWLYFPLYHQEWGRRGERGVRHRKWKAGEQIARQSAPSSTSSSGGNQRAASSKTED